MSTYSVEPRCDELTVDGPCIRLHGHFGAHYTIARDPVPWVDTTEDVTPSEEDGTND